MAKRLTKAEKSYRENVGKLMSYLVTRSMVARYDCLRPDPLRPRPERKTDLTETEQIFRGDKRIEAYLRADDLCDNTGIGSTIDLVCRLAVGTKGGSPIFSGAYKDSSTARWTAWKRTAGYFEDEPWQDMLQQILRCVLVHGDCIVMCNSLTDWKLRVWDADQICNCGDFSSWQRENGHPDWRQVEGVVLDGTGRVQGYFVTAQRNLIASSDCTYLPSSICRRVSLHRKVTGYRGEPLILQSEELSQDTKELIKSEIGAAKLAAQLSLIVTQAEGLDSSAIGGLLEGFKDTGELTEGTGITDEDLVALTESGKKDDKTFEAFGGKAAVASLPNGSTVTNLNNSARPSTSIQEWLNRLADENGKSVGIMSSLSRGRADCSYSAGELELAISWNAIENLQKVLERYVVDYVMDSVMPGSEYEVYWPKAFELDPQKAQATWDAKIRSGRTTYREMLGPSWREQLAELAEEKRYIESLGLDNLSFFQTVAGGLVGKNEQTPTEDKEVEDDTQA